MKTLRNLLFGLLSLATISGFGQEVPKDYFKADTIVKDNRTTITLYDSLDSPIYKEIKSLEGTSKSFYKYTSLKHKIQERISKVYDSSENEKYRIYLYFYYDKSGENEIMKKQYSYAKNFEPDVFSVTKKKLHKEKPTRETELLKYFSNNEKKIIKSKYNYSEDNSYTKNCNVKKYKDGELESKKRVIQYYGKDGKFLRYKDLK